MYRSIITALFGLCALKVSARPTHSRDESLGPLVKTLYLLSNKAPNSVVALPVSENGTVSAGTLTGTGGDGGVYLSPDGVTPEPVDALASQDGVVRSGNILYVVNTGSDSVSSFKIDSTDTTKLSLIESPTKLEGEFPVTIGVSEYWGLVCVGSAGTKNGVECFKASDDGCLTPDGQGLRSFGITAGTPPTMDTDGVSDLIFSADNKFLYAPVKGDGHGDHGWISAFPIENGAVAAQDVRTTIDDFQFLFGGFEVPGSDNTLFFSDASFGAVVLQMDSTGKATLVGKGVAQPAVTALCWAEYSPASKTAWVVSPISNSLLAMDVENASLVAQTNITSSLAGISDFVVPGKYLYGLATGSSNGSVAAITVVDVSNGASSPKTVQQFPIGYGVDNYAAGLAYI